MGRRRRRKSSVNIEIKGLDGTKVIVNRNTAMAVQTPLGTIYKPAGDLNSSDILAAAQYVQKPSIDIGKLITIIYDNSPEYKKAYDRLFTNLTKGDKTFPVTTFSNNLVEGLYMEMHQRGEVRSLEDLTIIQSEGIENYAGAEQAVVDAVYEAIDQYNFSRPNSLSATLATVRNWIRGKTMRSVKNGIYKALSEYEPDKFPDSRITHAPDWSIFAEWSQGLKYSEAWSTVASYHRVISRVIREQECVELTNHYGEKLEEIMGEEEADKKHASKHNKIESEKILQKIGLRSPREISLVIDGNPKETKIKQTVPRNIRVLENLDLKKADFGVSEAIMVAGDLRSIAIAGMHEFMDREHHFADEDKEYAFHIMLTSHLIISEYVPTEATNRINQKYMIATQSGLHIDWDMISKYRQIINNKIRDDGLKGYIANLIASDVAKNRLTYEKRKASLEDLAAIYAISKAEDELENVRKEIMILDEAFPKSEAYIDKHLSNLDSILDVFQYLSDLQPFIPKRYLEMNELQHQIALSDTISNLGKKIKEMYREFVLPENEVRQLELKMNQIHESLKQDYGNDVPGVSYEVKYF